MTKTEKENLKKEKEDPKKHQQSGPVIPLPTPLPTESTAAAEQTEAELATEQREMCWRKRHLTHRGDERWPGGGSTDSANRKFEV